MAESSVFSEISPISKGLYRFVSDFVGPECIVKLRRLKFHILETFTNYGSSLDYVVIVSGSRSEGFAFESSDFDLMHLDTETLLAPSSILITAPCYNKSVLLLMETENISPGFAFVRCLTCDDNRRTLYNSLVTRSSGIYVSSKQVRENFLSANSASIHGPCQTVTLGGVENDLAYTLKCPVWPTQAKSFIHRSYDRGWPSCDTLTDICKDGCLLVPINSKQQQYSDTMDLEWRISFSQAEKKIVHSMNQCQFLCYGLSRVFLNECVKKILPNEDDLCSYFMKTAVFWEIFHDRSGWLPINFLSKFWDVFRRLTKWVSTGYCPNFFIPENNMFYGKICGETQKLILRILRELHSEGYVCLLRCASLNQVLTELIAEPEITNLLSYDETIYIPQSMIQRHKIDTLFVFDIPFLIQKEETVIKPLLFTLLLHTESDVEIAAKRLRVNYILQCYAESLFSNTNQNRMTYRNLQRAQTVLYKTKTYFCTNYFILINHLYKSGNYQKSIEMIQFVKLKLKSHPFMYIWNLDDDIIMRALHQGKSYDSLMKSYIVCEILIFRSSIEELLPEIVSTYLITGGRVLILPPLVFLNCLLFFSYTKLAEYDRVRDVLEELHFILHHDDGHHIKNTHKAISWQILGICQQFYGDYLGALESYIFALHDEFNFNFIHATLARIFSLGVISF